MANRVITSLPYAQAEEFAVGANHPDGLADTINRGLVTAWGVEQHKTVNKITISGSNISPHHYRLSVDAGSYCSLPSGAFVVIDTTIPLDVPNGTKGTFRYLWIGLRNGSLSVEFGLHNAVAPSGLSDAYQTGVAVPSRSSVDDYYYVCVDGWVFYLAKYPLSGIFGAGLPETPTQFSLESLVPLGIRSVRFECLVQIDANNLREQLELFSCRDVGGSVRLYDRQCTGFTARDPVYGLSSFTTNIIQMDSNDAVIYLDRASSGSQMTHTLTISGYCQQENYGTRVN